MIDSRHVDLYFIDDSGGFMNHQELHAEALKRVQDFTASTMRLMEILEKIDRARTYLHLGYG